MSLTIAELSAQDLHGYKALRDSVMRQHEDAFTSDEHTESNRSASSYSQRLSVEQGGSCIFTLVAWRQGELIGAVSLERDKRTKVAHIGHVVGMMVRGIAQGQGIGKALMRDCVRRCEDNASLDLLTLSVTASNVAAKRLYESFGFTAYGLLPYAIKIDNRYLGKQLMARPLRDLRDLAIEPSLT